MVLITKTNFCKTRKAHRPRPYSEGRASCEPSEHKYKVFYNAFKIQKDLPTSTYSSMLSCRPSPLISSPAPMQKFWQAFIYKNIDNMAKKPLEFIKDLKTALPRLENAIARQVVEVEARAQ